MSLAELQQQLLAEREALLEELGFSETRAQQRALAAAAAALPPRKRGRGAAGPRAEAPTRLQPPRRRAPGAAAAAAVAALAGVEDGEEAAAFAARRARAAAAAAPRARSEAAAARAAAARGAAGGARAVQPDGSALEAASPAAPLPPGSLVKATVERDTVIRAFVEGALGLAFAPGRSYHELREDLPVNVYTTEYLVEAPSGEVFKGEAAKRAAGGAAFGRGKQARARGGGGGGGALGEGWRIYLRSRSYTRKLLKGQRFIYEK
jgi:hypothetical protein